MRIIFPDGESYAGRTEDDLVTAWKTQSPFTRNDTNRAFMKDWMPGIRGMGNFDHPTPNPTDAARFLRWAEQAGILRVYRGGDGLQDLPRGLGALGRLGEATATSFVARLPLRIDRWNVGGDGWYADALDGRSYWIYRTTTGYVAAGGNFPGEDLPFLDARGLPVDRGTVANAPRFRTPKQAILATQRNLDRG